jgi:hypothetical protein
MIVAHEGTTSHFDGTATINKAGAIKIISFDKLFNVDLGNRSLSSKGKEAKRILTGWLSVELLIFLSLRLTCSKTSSSVTYVDNDTLLSQ